MAKILVVEDNEMNMDMLTRRLQRNGFDVVMAINGAQGVELALTVHPVLIIMDMSLPVLDGWQATRHINSAPDT
ncbi:MAG: response regulator, partial [Burkholderiales bacterium]|nr:response regulator [Anaerolineae bacterium]